MSNHYLCTAGHIVVCVVSVCLPCVYAMHSLFAACCLFIRLECENSSNYCTLYVLCQRVPAAIVLRVSDEEKAVRVSHWPYYAYAVCDNERYSFALRRKAESLSLTASHEAPLLPRLMSDK